MILNKRLWEFLLEWVRMRIVLRQRQTFRLWHQYHQHITSSLVSGWGFRSLSPLCFASPATSPAQRAGQALEENALCAAGTQQLKDLHENECMFTLCPRFPCVLRKRGWLWGQMTLPYHKESQKQKQYIQQSDLTAHILMEPRTFIFLNSSPLKRLHYGSQRCFWASVVLTARVCWENSSLLLQTVANACCPGSEKLPELLHETSQTSTGLWICALEICSAWFKGNWLPLGDR